MQNEMKNKPNLIKRRLSTSWGKISEDAKRKKTMNRISCFLCNIISKSNIHEIWEVGEAGKFLNNGIFFFFGNLTAATYSQIQEAQQTSSRNIGKETTLRIS